MLSVHMPIKLPLSDLIEDNKASRPGGPQADVIVIQPPCHPTSTNYNCVVSITVAIGSRKQSKE